MESIKKCFSKDKIIIIMVYNKVIAVFSKVNAKVVKREFWPVMSKVEEINIYRRKTYDFLDF